MKKKHIISLCGELASGKGTVSRLLAEKLEFGIYCNGDYARSLAKELGMDITAFNVYVKEHPEIDRQIEQNAREYAKEHENFVIDARLGWYAVPESFKVYLKVDINEAARRAFYDVKRKSSENLQSIEEQKIDMQKRYQLENERYYNLYGVRKEDESNYDIVIDTTNMTAEQVTDIIIQEYEKWLKS